MNIKLEFKDYTLVLELENVAEFSDDTLEGDRLGNYLVSNKWVE